MRDTRLWDLLSDIESALRITRDITDAAYPQERAERDRVEQERKPFYAARDGLRTAHRIVLEALGDQVCGRRDSVGSECTIHAGHTSGHRSMWGHAWTDEQDAVWARNIAATITGRD